MPSPNECSISGIIYKAGQLGGTAEIAANTRLRITPISVAGIALSSKSFTVTSDATGAISWSSVQGSTINIEGPVLGFNTSGGASVLIPALSSYAFESLVAITVTPATFGNPMSQAGDVIVGTTGGAAARLGIGSTGQILTVAGGIPAWATPTSGGTVSSVGLSLSLFTITNSPVTTTGTLTGTLTAQNPNIVLAGPTSGGAVPPTFRSLVAADIPDLSATYLVKANNLSDVNATAARNNLGLGSIATQAASAVAITGGTVAGLTGLALRSTGAGFDLTLASSEVLTAGRTLSFVLGDTARTLTIGAAASVSGTNTGDQTTVSGNAGSATVLQTARAINGVNFDGSAPITVTAAAGTLTGNTLASGVTASSLTSHGTVTSGGLGTGAVIGGVTMTLGADASGDVYYRNSSGVLTRVAAGAQNTIFTMGASSVPSWAAAAGLTVGTTTITSGTTTRVLFDNAGVLGEYSITGTGNVAMSASPTFTGTVGAAAMTATGTIVQTSASAAALESGPNGSTNPVLRLVNSTASQASGLSITGNAAGVAVALNVIDSGSNTGITIASKGFGAVTIQNTNGSVILGTGGNVDLSGTSIGVAAGTGFAVGTGRNFGFSSTSLYAGTIDAAIKRNNVGIVEVNNGTAGQGGAMSIRGTGATHGEDLFIDSKSELLTLGTGSTTTVTVGNLAPANAKIIAITYRITTTITTAANFNIKVTGGNAFANIGTATTSQTTLTANTTGVLVPVLHTDQYNTTATTLTVTLNANPGAGVIRLTVHYISPVAATS